MLMRVLVAGAVAVMLAGAAAAGSLEDIEALWLSAAPRTDITMLRRAADQGDARSQYRLGMMYDLGLGVPLDYAEAANWLRKAANQGDDRAQAVLAAFYERGRGVPLDYSEAVKWYRLAAEQGDVFGLIGLGNLYENGKGVPMDYVLAYMCFTVSIRPRPPIALEGWVRG
jgi:TPR repeat protein